MIGLLSGGFSNNELLNHLRRHEVPSVAIAVLKSLLHLLIVFASPALLGIFPVTKPLLLGFGDDHLMKWPTLYRKS